MRLALVPMTYAAAAAYVAEHHRHLPPPTGHKFSIGVATGGQLVGVVMVGRPVARHLDDGHTLEVNRCAMLYGAAWRAAKALGYSRLITYTHADESGASLRGAGWRIVAERPARPGWDTPSRPRDNHSAAVQRILWEAI